MIPYISYSVTGAYAGGDDLARAELAMHGMDIEGAIANAAEGIKKARKGKQHEVVFHCLLITLRCAFMEGDIALIRATLRDLEAQLGENDYQNRFTYFSIAQGWFLLHIGLYDHIAEWLKNDFMEGDLGSLVYGLEIILKGGYHLSKREYTECLAALHGAQGPMGPDAFIYGKIEMRAMEAVCRFSLGDVESAFRIFDEALSLAAPCGFYMPFIEYGRDMVSLAGSAMSDSRVKTERRVLERIRGLAARLEERVPAIAETFVPEFTPLPAGSPLSAREESVLTMMKQELTVGEMAFETGLAESEIETIIEDIKEKGRG
jgi:LuxR family maltose regulon positive regulatory protein